MHHAACVRRGNRTRPKDLPPFPAVLISTTGVRGAIGPTLRVGPATKSLRFGTSDNAALSRRGLQARPLLPFLQVLALPGSTACVTILSIRRPQGPRLQAPLAQLDITKTLCLLCRRPRLRRATRWPPGRLSAQSTSYNRPPDRLRICFADRRASGFCSTHPPPAESHGHACRAAPCPEAALESTIKPIPWSHHLRPGRECRGPARQSGRDFESQPRHTRPGSPRCFFLNGPSRYSPSYTLLIPPCPHPPAPFIPRPVPRSLRGRDPGPPARTSPCRPGPPPRCLHA